MSEKPVAPRKAKALRKGSKLAVFAPASPSERIDVFAGVAELRRLGFEVDTPSEREPQGYFAGSREERIQEFLAAIRDDKVEGLIAARGGYGSNDLLEADLVSQLQGPKCVVGFSDLTTLQIYLWQMCGWVTFQGPMAAKGFNHGADDACGYDEESFLRAVSCTASGWEISLKGETLVQGEAEGRILGGCLTLVQATLGTPWELDTEGAILLLEDVGMKPYQADRVLMHLKQAGKLEGVRGFVLGEFPADEAQNVGGAGVGDVCERILAPLGLPVVFGAAVGHTKRPMLTFPLGVRARLRARGEGKVEILEAAVE